MLCPKCKTDSAHRAHRINSKERLVSVVAYYPYRCGCCSYRFHNFRFWVTATPATAPPVRGAERQIAATRGALLWKHKRREILLYSTALVLFAFVLYFLTREPSIGN
jgi:hypothetical protein